MGRLTKKIKSNVPVVVLKALGIEDVPTECVEIIKVDDNTCSEVCEQYKCRDCPINEAFEKLAHYEDLEEQGRLIKLPCAVGDTVWKITTQRDTFDDREYPVIIQLSFRMDMLSLIKKGIVFLTKEEAEAKLKELEGDKE